MADPAALAAGQPAPFRQLTRPRSRALWARGGHYGASQVPGCDNIGPGGIDIEHLTRVDATLTGEMPEPVRTSGSRVTPGPPRHTPPRPGGRGGLSSGREAAR